MNKRQLSLDSDFKHEEQDDKKVVRGYYVVYGQETLLGSYGGVDYYEMIKHGALDRSLNEDDILSCYDHQLGELLGRTSADTFKLTSDNYGVYGETTINEEDRNALDIYARAKRGDLKGASFSFVPTKEQFIQRDNGSVLTVVEEAKVYEMSMVAFPAYDETSVSARSNDVDKFMTEKRIEERRKEILSNFGKGND